MPDLRRIIVHPPNNEINDIAFTAQLPWTLSTSVESATFCGPGISRTLFAEFCFPLAKRVLGRLQHLSLKITEGAPSAGILEAIMEMDTLESLELKAQKMSVSLQQIISRKAARGVVLRNLRSLSLDLDCASYLPQLSFSDLFLHKGLLLPRLNNFKFVSCSGSRICTCMPIFLSEKMTSLTLTLSANITSEGHFKPLAHSLRQVSSLKSITLAEGNGSSVIVKDAKSIAPLLSLPIEELHVGLSTISWPGPFSSASVIISPALSQRPFPIQSITLPKKIDALPFILPHLSEIATSLPMLERLTLGLSSQTQVRALNLTWGAFPSTSELLTHWGVSQAPSSSRLRHLSIYEQKPLDEFNTQQYNDLAQLLDIMFPQLISITPYCESDREAPYWRDHWWFIEHLRKMYKRIRLLEASSSK